VRRGARVYARGRVTDEDDGRRWVNGRLGKT